MTIKRGDMFYADLSPVVGSEQGGIRPVLIIQNNLGNKYYEYLNNRIICNLVGLSDNIFNSNLKFPEKYKNEKAILNQKIYIEGFRKFPFNSLTFSWRIFFGLCHKRQALLLSLFITIGEHLKGIMK